MLLPVIRTPQLYHVVLSSGSYTFPSLSIIPVWLIAEQKAERVKKETAGNE